MEKQWSLAEIKGMKVIIIPGQILFTSVNLYHFHLGGNKGKSPLIVQCSLESNLTVGEINSFENPSYDVHTTQIVL